MQLRLAGAQQGHALLAAGDQQGTQIQLGHQCLAFFQQGLFVRHRPHHRLELGQIGGQQGGAPVAAEITALGVHQHRHAGLAGQGDQPGAVAQGALGVIGQHQGAAAGQPAFHLLGERRRVLVLEGLLEIQPQQLLLAADHAQLGDGGQPGHFLEVAQHIGGAQALLQNAGGLILAGEPHQFRPGPQGGHVERHVGGAAGAVLQFGDAHHRHRGLRRDTPGRAVPISVQHHVAGDQHAGLAKGGNSRVVHHLLLRHGEPQTGAQCSIAVDASSPAEYTLPLAGRVRPDQGPRRRDYDSRQDIIL